MYIVHLFVLESFNTSIFMKAPVHSTVLKTAKKWAWYRRKWRGV